MSNIAIILQWLAEGAIEEVRVPKLLSRDGAIYWRTNGEMVRLTAGERRITMITERV